MLRSSLRVGLVGIDRLTRHDFPQALELAWPGGAVVVADFALARLQLR